MTTDTPDNRGVIRILRLKQLERRIGLKKSTIYAKVAANEFPQPVKLGGPRAVGWIESEIEAWLAQQIGASRATPVTDILDEGQYRAKPACTTHRRKSLHISGSPHPRAERLQTPCDETVSGLLKPTESSQEKAS